MEIRIDFSGIRNEDQVLYKLGEVFEFGGPNGNIKVLSPIQGNGWGLNWGALNDSLRYLHSGGIWGASKKFTFPLTIIFENTKDLRSQDPESFRILQEILIDRIRQYRDNGLVLDVLYS